MRAPNNRSNIRRHEKHNRGDGRNRKSQTEFHASRWSRLPTENGLWIFLERRMAGSSFICEERISV